jgi:hypothetical protein
LVQFGTGFRHCGLCGKSEASEMHVHVRWPHIHISYWCECTTLNGENQRHFGSIWNRLHLLWGA